MVNSYSPYMEELADTGHTALDLACLFLQVDLMRGLLEVEESDLARPIVDRLTMLAVCGGVFFEIGCPRVSDEYCLYVLQLLAEKGADFSRAGLGDYSHSPLSLACEWSLERSAEFLLAKGVAVGGVAGKNGEFWFLWLRYRRLVPP
uniref:Uncharacterized protein n=1 Tax=Chromera velia CCMP2878 TaxID=1169474 RepID=A0A0K6S5Z8_9ALVE|eukprot:Cvel_14583.t1-p1 / transcript=Cvel_14583.t1 / gene=Cvel_14583 / organism=Chromera_velia_CCMP2878 / gene_product=hypothetical protein / transcript_product=hypothetical protein / location=Cvel_scaffold1042:46945-47382(+) / protein_length=146 / sequence_SO=supercontig / SO=protein_coding / is_pseudo=false